MEKNMTLGSDVAEFIQLLEKWHTHKTTQLKTIINNKDVDLDIEGDKIKANSDMAKGVRFGVALSLHMLGDLPFETSVRQGG